MSATMRPWSALAATLRVAFGRRLELTALPGKQIDEALTRLWQGAVAKIMRQSVGKEMPRGGQAFSDFTGGRGTLA